jgi:hypothetical protein
MADRCLLTGHPLPRHEKASTLRSFALILACADTFIGFAEMITLMASIGLIELARHGDADVDADLRRHALRVLPRRWLKFAICK